MKILSIVLIILGALFLLVGMAFKIMHWPDLFNGMVSGPLILAMGILLFFLWKRNS